MDWTWMRVSQRTWVVVILVMSGIAASAQVRQNSSFASAPQTQVPPAGQRLVPNPPAPSVSELPDSPSATLAQSHDEQPQEQQASPANSTTQGGQSTPDNADSSRPQPGQPEAPAGTSSSSQQKPVGTAAAEAPKASGVAASQPAGVAIAPAKQHRVRTIVLKTGAILGACVAVGTVVGLTASTPSKPPGAH